MRFRRVCNTEVSLPPTERVYKNDGNGYLIEVLDEDCSRVLDIGCGAGDNAVLVRSKAPECRVFGITHSAVEAEAARPHLEKCWIVDIEGALPTDLAEQSFDVLIFSHVLEHLRNPDAVVTKFSRLLRKGGQVLIAVPNIAVAAMRLQLLFGDFQYQPSGLLDDTHLHFYSYFTADKLLLSKAPDLKLTHKSGPGHIPLPLIRKYVLPVRWGKSIDQWGARHWPNLFGTQIILKAVKQ